jgi:hypothetical protein
MWVKAQHLAKRKWKGVVGSTEYSKIFLTDEEERGAIERQACDVRRGMSARRTAANKGGQGKQTKKR